MKMLLTLSLCNNDEISEEVHAGLSSSRRIMAYFLLKPCPFQLIWETTGKYNIKIPIFHLFFLSASPPLHFTVEAAVMKTEEAICGPICDYIFNVSKDPLDTK